MSLPEALEQAASELPDDADAIRPANGDPFQLLDSLDADASVRVLAWLLCNAPEAGEELAADWSEDDRGLAPLQRIDEKSLPKPGRKVLRRVLHRLRSMGVELQPTAPAEPKVAKLPEISDGLDAAYLAEVDARGSYLVFLAEDRSSGGGRLFQIVLDELRGVVDFQVYTAGRSKLRGFLRSLKGSAVEAEPAYVRALVGRVAELHPHDRVLPRGFSEWKRKLVETAAEATPGERVREALGTGSDDEALERICGRVSDGSLGPWPADSDLLTRVGKQLEEALEGARGLPAEESAEVRAESLASASQQLFDEAHRQRTARRFEQNAYVLWRLEKADAARDCLAAAASLREASSSENPIARSMTEACFAPILERALESGDESEESTPSAEA